ncbi:SprT-like domain-containing protein [Orrella marina]|nr:SprT-like domain-containing protein [Orrella marina]
MTAPDNSGEPNVHVSDPPACMPTVAFYAQLQRAFDHFNRDLFEGRLPPCLITLRSSSRHYGYHHKERFVNRQGQMIDELGLHPGFFTLRPVEEVLSTLVHEMVHHWQDCFGSPTRSNPHNREWADRMRSVGLEPSSTGLPGGESVGRAVSHYILPEGPFMASCKGLLADGFELSWFDRYSPRESVTAEQRQQALKESGFAVEFTPPPVQTIVPANPDRSVVITPAPRKEVDRVKFSCSGCDTKAWASSQAELLCGRCSLPMSHNAQ